VRFADFFRRPKNPVNTSLNLVRTRFSTQTKKNFHQSVDKRVRSSSALDLDKRFPAFEVYIGSATQSRP